MVFVIPGGFCPPGSFGLDLPRVSASGQGCVSSASRAWYRPMCVLRFLGGDFPTFSSQGFSYVLTLINRTSMWPEAVPLSTITTNACARSFISTWFEVGVPALLTFDGCVHILLLVRGLFSPRNLPNPDNKLPSSEQRDDREVSQILRVCSDS